MPQRPEIPSRPCANFSAGALTADGLRMLFVMSVFMSSASEVAPRV